MSDQEIVITSSVEPGVPAGTGARLRQVAEAAAGVAAGLADHIPSPIEVARRLKAAHDNSAADAQQQLLLRELMAHYRQWCLGRDIGDPFLAVAAEARG